MKQSKYEEVSQVWEEVKARPRPVVEYDIAPIFCMGQRVTKVAVRVPSKREQDVAWQAAHDYVEKLSENNPSVLKNADILQDALAAHIVAVAFRDPTRPDKMPAFPSGAALSEVATPDEIAALTRLAMIVREKHGPSPEPNSLDDDRIEAFATMAAAGEDSNAPDIVLASMPQSYLSQLYIRTCAKLFEARAELDALRNAKHEN